MSKRLLVEQIIIHDPSHVKIFLPNKSLPNAYVAVRYLGQFVIACRTQAALLVHCNKTSALPRADEKRTSNGIKK
ncbi:hypothetical protein [Collimonas humicola]|uniref:hypothetical protein n=1 Tax=Collimonas humicola TaxID=2825886 RepID=UPI001B8CF209|nr:hypothetical protein [Collimonas humicola]